MNPIVVPDVEVTFGDIPEEPFKFNRENVRINDSNTNQNTFTMAVAVGVIFLLVLYPTMAAFLFIINFIGVLCLVLAVVLLILIWIVITLLLDYLIHSAIDRGIDILGPFKTKRKNIRIDDNGITFDSKTYQWGEIGTENIKMNFFMGNPYLQFQTNNQIISFWFPRRWYQRHKAPWFGTSQFLTEEFIKRLSEGLNDLDLTPRLNEQLKQPPILKGFGKWYHKTINLGFFLLPLIIMRLLLIIFIYVITTL